MSCLDYGVVSHPGAAKHLNEDAYAVDPSQGVFLVADGVGGLPAGEVASQTAVEKALSFLHQHSSGAVSAEEILAETIYAAHKGIQQKAELDASCWGMGTTLLIARIMPAEEIVITAHVGNCRAYRLHNNILTQLTQDHTMLNQLRLANQLPSDPSEWPPRSQLSQILSHDPYIFPEVSRHTLIHDDRLLLCTDGVSDVLDQQTLAEIMVQSLALQDTCQVMVDACLERQAKDNITVLVIQMMSLKVCIQDTQPYPKRGK